jgi:hypothetical protein
MMKKALAILFAVGALLMCVPGLLTEKMHWETITCLAIGFAIMIAATIKSRSFGPWSALWLLAASNLSFWSCYGLWHVRLRFIDGPSMTGIDPFAGTLALWCIFLFVFMLYECVILLWAIFMNRQRIPALVIMVAALAQIPLTLKFAWEMVQGV